MQLHALLCSMWLFTVKTQRSTKGGAANKSVSGSSREGRRATNDVSKYKLSQGKLPHVLNTVGCYGNVS